MVHKQQFPSLFHYRAFVWHFVFLLCLLPSAWAFDILSLGQSAPTSPAVVETEQVRAELLLHAPQGWQAGQTAHVALHISHAPDWHTYWRNPGDSGAAIELQWALPEGAELGDVAWPLPERIPVLDMLNYGYSHDVLLSQPVHISRTPEAGQSLRLHARWLVCRVECIPQEGEFEIALPAGPATAQQALFEQSWQAVPQDWSAQPSLSLTLEGDDWLLRSLEPSHLQSWQGQKLSVYAEEAQLLHHPAAGEQSWSADGHWQWRVPINQALHTAPEHSFWVLSNGQEAVRLQAQSSNAAAIQAHTIYQRNTAGMAITPELAAALAANAQGGSGNKHTGSGAGLWAALLLAFGGGVLLNLMPCVFPVLAIKVLGLSQSSSASERRRHAWLYALGVVLSFLLLAGLLLALKAGGAALGWGFQLQSPLFLLLLLLLFALMALNLSGAWELGQVLPQRWLNAQSRHASINSLLTGALAVAVASPCTAPFMGAALGYALSQSAAVALLVFFALGLGMALPFVLLAHVPAVAKLLPQPGAWMDALKRLLAVPLWLTAVWLLWVLGQQTSLEAVALSLAGLIVLLSIWVLAWSLRYKRSALFLALLLALGAVLLRPEIQTAFAPAQAGPATNEAGQTWQSWSPERQQELLQAGQSVFVDYTAAWCVTCQYNKKTVLSQPAVLARFAEHGVSLLRADWTAYDENITHSLQALGRSGVPTYVLIGADGRQQLLPELLSVSAVDTALANL